MLREFAACLVMPAAGCSYLLDFSDPAIPVDAAGDAPFTAAECDYKEPNDSAPSAAAIEPGDTGPAAICAPPDRDFYRLSVPAGATRVELAISMAARRGDLDLRLFDPAGTQIASSVGFDDEERIVCPASLPSQPACPMLAAGDYVFEVVPVAGAINRYAIAIAIQ